MYTDNNPLTYILMMAKLDIAPLGGQFDQLQLLVILLNRKTSVDTDALSRVSWLGCMPDNSGTHLQVTAAAVWAVQEAALKSLTSSIEAYSCNLHILDSVQDSHHVACMTLKDWHQAQQADPTLSLVISKLWDGTLGWWQSKQTDPPKCPIQKNQTQEIEETLFQLVLPAPHSEVTLKGCHDDVGHLGLECMLDLMHDWFLWPHMAAQAKEHIGKCHPCLTFKAKQPKAPLENIMVTHPLELVHLDYLCLEPRKGLEGNVLLVTNHFTQYAQVYTTLTQTTQTTTKTL